MSLSSALDSKTGRISSSLIPPRIAKGELVTGGYTFDDATRKYVESAKWPNDLDKIVVPAGEDGSVLQADSTTNTGLRWVPHEPVAKSLRKSVNSIARFLKPLVQERALKEAERLELMPKFFVRSTTTGDTVIYTIPLDTNKPVQSVIDYLDETFIFSLTNGCSQVVLQRAGQVMEPGKTLADYNIQNESTITAVCRQQYQGGARGTVRYRHRRIHKKNRSSKTVNKK